MMNILQLKYTLAIKLHQSLLGYITVSVFGHFRLIEQKYCSYKTENDKRYFSILKDMRMSCQKQNITNQPQLKRYLFKKFKQFYQFNLHF